jgi:hypothetical protein
MYGALSDERMSVIYSAIIYWLESHKAHNRILLSHLGLPKPGGPVPLTHIPHERGGRVQSHVTTDGLSISQYVLVSSARCFGGTAFERILIRHKGGILGQNC